MNIENRIEDLTKDVIAKIKAKSMSELKELLNSTNEVDALEIMQGLSADNQAIVFRLLSKDNALFVFERLEINSQQELIESFSHESALEIIEALGPDDRVSLFDEMPAAFVKKMLSALPKEDRDATNLVMGYKSQTAGRIMTTEYVRVSRSLTVADALEKIKENAKEKETIYTIYITDDARKLEGVVSLRDLWIADPAAKVGDVMKEITAKVATDTDQEEVARLLQRLDWLAIPVVDREDRLVGIVTIDDAVDILEDEATEDMMGAAGLKGVAGKEADRSVLLTKGSLPKIWLVRMPFLLIALAGGIAAGFIIEGFEEVLTTAVVVAFFIPVILDMGGSVGSQSSTVFARGLVLGHINTKSFLKPLFKEAAVGLTMGIISGAIAAGIIILWQGDLTLALVVAAALALTMTVAATLGFLTPFVTMKMKLDQAAASAPIITTVKDITGLFIYFALVVLFMSSYLEPAYEVTGQYITTNEGVHFFVDLENEEAFLIDDAYNEGYMNIPYEIEVGGYTFPVRGLRDETALE
ncbi:MAG: magnesium transporter [Defluviitaleaceae bacterium]|nr:magnesium transporter [Defluviitaleaceae bacterium]